MATRPVQVGDVLGVVTWAANPDVLFYKYDDGEAVSFTDGSYIDVYLYDSYYYRVRFVPKSGSVVYLAPEGNGAPPTTWNSVSFDFGGRTVSKIDEWHDNDKPSNIGSVIQVEDAPVPEPLPNNLKAYYRKAGNEALIPVTPYFRKAGNTTLHRLGGIDFRSPPPPSTTYLTFQSESPFTLGVYNGTKNWNGTLYYSTNTTTWNEWNGTTLSSVGNKLYLRGTGNTVITGSSDTAYRWVLTGTAIECVGNIENLLDWEAVALGEHPTMAARCYQNMFRDCTSLTTAPELPATTLATSCYQNMFYGCTSLTIAPALPTTTLANYCYYAMFNGCTSLTTAPELPATTLAERCYERVFYGCTSLTTAPALPATTLTTNCYYEMFRGCTSLATAPALPATTLGANCYLNMFGGCTSLTIAPALPATTLKDGCYYYMFYGCSVFKVSATQIGSYQHAWRIPTSGTGTTATNWNSFMLYATGGAFKNEPVINTTYYVENPPV